MALTPAVAPPAPDWTASLLRWLLLLLLRGGDRRAGDIPWLTAAGTVTVGEGAG